MSEIETNVLEEYKKALAGKDGISPELIQALSDELSKEAPNAEKVAEIVKLKKDFLPK